MNYVDGETRIVLIGKTGSGKSSIANTLLGVSHFRSLLSSVSVTKKTSSQKAQYEGRDVLIIDTPGLFDTETRNSEMKKKIMKCVALASPGLHAVVLVTKIGRFTEEENYNIQEFKKYFGEGLDQYLIIVFTGKDDLDAADTNLENYLRDADPVLKKVVEDCCYRCLAVNNRACEEEKIKFKRNLLTLVDDNVRRNGGKCYTNDLFEDAEMFMKQAEAKKMAELKDEKRKEREETERKMRGEHEAQIEEMKRETQKQFDIIKQANDELERLRMEWKQMKENSDKLEERHCMELDVERKMRVEHEAQMDKMRRDKLDIIKQEKARLEDRHRMEREQWNLIRQIEMEEVNRRLRAAEQEELIC